MISRAIALVASLCLLHAAPAHAPAQDANQPEPPQAESQVESQAAEPAGPPEGLESPRATVRTFLEAMSQWSDSGAKRHLDKALSCLDLAGIPFAAEVGPQLAERVEGAMRAAGIDADSASLFPRARDVEGRTEGTIAARVLGRSYQFTRTEDGAWRLSGETVRTLNELYLQRHPSLLARTLRSIELGFLVEGSVVGVRYDQWLGIFLILLAGVAIDFLIRAVVRLICRQYLRREEDEQTRSDTASVIRKAAKPFGLTAGAVVVYILLGQLDLNPTALSILRTAARVFALFAGVWAAYRVVDLGAEYLQRRATATESKFDDLLIPLLRKAVKIFVIAFGLVFLAEALSLPIASLLAGLGIGGLAFAFAAKDTIENLFGSVAVILDRPFSVGDWINVEGVEGIVEELGFRSTRIRTFYNSLVTVPNARLVRATVDNYGLRRYRRFSTNIAVTYDTPADTIEAFCEGIREIIREHPCTRKDFFEVHLNSFGAHSLDILVYMFFSTPDWSTELAERHRFMLDVIRLADRMGVEFAFPTQTLHVFSETRPEQPAPEGRTPESAARDRGRRTATEVLADAEWRRESPS